MSLTRERMETLFTPTKEEQLLLILKGECPHNKGWSYAGPGHNDDAYECKLCGKTEWY